MADLFQPTALVLLMSLCVLTRTAPNQQELSAFGGQLSKSEAIIVAVVAIVLCIAVSFAAHCLYLRMPILREHNTSYHRTEQDGQVLCMNRDTPPSESDALLLCSKSLSALKAEYEERKHSQDPNTAHTPSYISFGVDDILEERDSTSPYPTY